MPKIPLPHSRASIGTAAPGFASHLVSCHARDRVWKWAGHGLASRHVTTETAVIPVRNQNQALDWGLVLASQGIVCRIVASEAGGDWGLEIARADLARAIESLRLYKAENRGWRWRQEMPWPGLTFHWGGAVFGFFLLLMHAATDLAWPGLQRAGVMDSQLFRAGEWWRAVTALTLHGDTAHLVSNLATGFLLLGLAMARFGAGAGLLAALLTGVAGNVLGFWLYPNPFRGLGASGMILGALGLLIFPSARTVVDGWPAAKRLLGGALAGVMLFLLFGSNPNADWVAHLGGFVAGCALGAVLGWVPAERLLDRRVSRVSLGVFVVLLAVVWGLALSGRGQ